MDIERFRPPRGATVLAVIDIQERLAPAMPPDDYAGLLRATGNLVAMAREQSLPVLATEQYPKGLGPTVKEVREAFAGEIVPAEKITFSAFGCDTFTAALTAAWPLRSSGPGLPANEAPPRSAQGTLARAVIVVGMEAHVCVVETALDALAAGLRVFVPRDGVCSRDPRDRDAGLALLREAGATITTSETLIFQALGRAGTPSFKTLSARLRTR